jgi:hypothetical protein
MKADATRRGREAHEGGGRGQETAEREQSWGE